MEFFKDLESVDGTKMSGLKAGKVAEQAEFDNLLREVEKELDQAASQAPRRRSEDEVRVRMVWTKRLSCFSLQLSSGNRPLASLHQHCVIFYS